MDGVENKANVGVTFDTCHVLDAGYDLENDYDGVMRQLDEVIGLAEGQGDSCERFAVRPRLA